MSLPLHTHATVQGLETGGLYKVLGLREALSGAYDPKHVLVRPAENELEVVDALLEHGFAGIERSSSGVDGNRPGVFKAQDVQVIGEGDVIRVRPSNGMVSVLFRRSAASNWLFLTERCNSLCLMCSQPPRNEEDRWRVDEANRLIPLLDRKIDYLGITGGEPLLLGKELFRLLETCRLQLPDTNLHVLSNGRLFEDIELADEAAIHRQHVTWAIPLYSDVGELHDHIVQASGAFRETLHGVLNLAERQCAIEIRVVLHKLSIDRLIKLAEFITRNIPFARHVALMGLEPIGLAKRNMDSLWIDPVDYAEALAEATHVLADAGMRVSIYNLPLCVIPSSVRTFARQSISEWKNMFPAECNACSWQSKCAGFFSSAGVVWLSRGIAPTRECSR